MIWKHRGVQLSLEHYHGVPPGWSGDGIAYMHQTMRPMHELAPIEIGKWGAPSWMTNRYEWLRYKQGLEHVADGIRASCPACCEIAVRYIVIRYIGSYSGYIRAKLARRLRHAPLLDRQKRRLTNHLLALVEDDDLTAEFRDYTKLWARIINDRTLQKLKDHAARTAQSGRFQGLLKTLEAAVTRSGH